MPTESHQSYPVPMPEVSPPSGADRLEPRPRVTGPAIGIMVCSLLGLLYCLGFLLWTFVLNGDDTRGVLATRPTYCALAVGVPTLVAVLDAAMLFGSIQMLRRRSYAWAKAASILALIPCNFLVVLSFGFGVWGLLVLRSDRAKSLFG